MTHKRCWPCSSASSTSDAARGPTRPHFSRRTDLSREIDLKRAIYTRCSDSRYKRAFSGRRTPRSSKSLADEQFGFILINSLLPPHIDISANAAVCFPHLHLFLLTDGGHVHQSVRIDLTRHFFRFLLLWLRRPGELSPGPVNEWASTSLMNISDEVVFEPFDVSVSGIRVFGTWCTFKGKAKI